MDMIEDGVCGSPKSLTRVTTLLREICCKAVRRMERNRKMRIGGRTAFVAIDESKFRHKRKVRFYTLLKQGQWVLNIGIKGLDWGVPAGLLVQAHSILAVMPRQHH